MDDKVQEELRLEEEARGLGVDRYRRHVQIRPLSELPPGLRQMQLILEPLAEAIREWMAQRNHRRTGPIISKLWEFEPIVLAFMTARFCLNAMATRFPVTRTALKIASLLEDEANFRRFSKNNQALFGVVAENLKTCSSYRHKRYVLKRMQTKAGLEEVRWSRKEKVHIGLWLIQLFVKNSGLVEIVRDTVRGNDHGGKKRRVITPMYLQATPKATEWLKKAHARCELLSPMFMPMIVKPKPWTRPFGGGYISPHIRLKVVKTRNRNYLDDLESLDLGPVYRAINALQDTAWRINKKVYEVMAQAWLSGGGLGGLPTADNLPLPQRPADMDTNEEARKKWKRAASEIHELNHRLQSKRFAVVTKLWLAEKFLDEEELYFPHCLDWRSRAYPVPVILNPQADDTGRALLKFAEGKRIGKKGIKWLAKHGANMFGEDKCTIVERVQWVKKHQAEILDSARNPLDGQRFWTQADKPYQFLAFCFEWAGVVKHGENFLSHLPVSMDGSCNGLQNFSAMLRDEIGGKAVNLLPSKKPQDIYGEVAKVVARKVSDDLARGVQEAADWVGKIDRKIVKRNVMTLPYGATAYGMREQLVDELKKSSDVGRILMNSTKWKSTLYLSRVIYESIGEVVIAARKAMDWLQTTARIASGCGSAIRWTNPIGFPVLQQYRQMRYTQVNLMVGGVRLQPVLISPDEKIDTKKQAQGIAPNFVHSMDAAHMMATINSCLDKGITAFGMVHDSYATHAVDTETMANVLREEFVKQYHKDVLKQFRDELKVQLPEDVGAKLPKVPQKGGLDLSKVKKSVFFFS